MPKGAADGGAAGGASHEFKLGGASRLAVAATASAAWMAVSSALILLNKDLLSHGFSYPMALSGLGMGFSSVAAFLCCRVLGLVEAKRTVTPRFYVQRCMPIGLFMALTLWCGNAVYLHLTVAFIQMLKALTPVITMATLFAAGLETPTRRLVAAVSLIALGTAVASAGEVNLSLTGVGIMMASECFESVRLVMTQTLLTGLRFHPIEGLMYLAPACFFWLAAGSAALEWRAMAAAGALDLVRAAPLKFAAAGAMGFAVNSLAYIVIQTASSLTLKVLGTVKNALVVVLGVVALREAVAPVQGAGYALSVAAFVWYNRIKAAQIRAGEGAGGGGGGVPGGAPPPRGDVEGALERAPLMAAGARSPLGGPGRVQVLAAAAP